MISRVHIWKAATGGGLPVDYLRWLAAMWEQYLCHDGPESFDDWLVAKFQN